MLPIDQLINCTMDFAPLYAWCRSVLQCSHGSSPCAVCEYDFAWRWHVMHSTMMCYGYLDIELFGPRWMYDAWMMDVARERKWSQVAPMRNSRATSAMDLETYEFTRRPATPKSYGRVSEYRDVRPKNASVLKQINGRSVIDAFPALSERVDEHYKDNRGELVTMGVYTSLSSEMSVDMQRMYSAGRINAVAQIMIRAVYNESPKYDDSVFVLYVSHPDSYKSLVATAVAERTVRNIYAGEYTPDIKMTSSAQSTRGIMTTRAGSHRIFVLIYRDAELNSVGVGAIFRSADLMIRGAKTGRLVITKHVGDALQYVVENIGGDMFVTYSSSARKLLWMEGISKARFDGSSADAKRLKIVMEITTEIGRGLTLHSYMERRAILKLTHSESIYYDARVALNDNDIKKFLSIVDSYTPNITV